MAFRLLKNEPALTPLFVAVGAGVVGSAWFASHYLRQSDVALVKNSEPWNKVRPDQNTKLFSSNKEFWASRKDMPHPQASFMGEEAGTSSKSRIQKAKALAQAKAKESLEH